jgi:hypothetical protein
MFGPRRDGIEMRWIAVQHGDNTRYLMLIPRKYTVTDCAANSQALRDTERATLDLRDAVADRAPAEVVAELTAVHAAAQARVLSLRQRA